MPFGCLLSTCVNGHSGAQTIFSEMDMFSDEVAALSHKLIKPGKDVYALSGVRNGELIFVVESRCGEYRQIRYSGNTVKFSMNINSKLVGSWCFIQGELSGVNVFDPVAKEILSTHTDIVKKHISHGNKSIVLKLVEHEIMSLIDMKCDT